MLFSPVSNTMFTNRLHGAGFVTYSADTGQRYTLVLHAHERPWKNKRIARHKLKLRKPNTGESFDNFVKDIRLILMDCEYTDPDDILIDSISDGVHAKKLQERLLDRGEELTLAKAIKIGQQ